MDKQTLIKAIAFEEKRDISNDHNWNEDKQFGYIQGLKSCLRDIKE